MKHSVRRVELLEEMGKLAKGQIITLDATLAGKLIKAGKAELVRDGKPIDPPKKPKAKRVSKPKNVKK